MRDQQLDDVGAAGAHGRHERGFALGPDLRIRSGVEEPGHDLRAPVGAGERERGHAVVVGEVHVRAGADQELHRAQVVPVDGPVERGRAVRSWGVDLHPSGVEERAHRRRAPSPEGVDDRFRWLRGPGSGGEQQDQNRQRTNATWAHHRDLPLTTSASVPACDGPGPCRHRPRGRRCDSRHCPSTAPRTRCGTGRPRHASGTHTSGSVSVTPAASPNCSVGAPNLSSRLSSRLDIGVRCG